MKANQHHPTDTLTPEQKALWNGLKDAQLLGQEFNLCTEEVEGSVMFHCPSKHLLIEIDDSSASSLHDQSETPNDDRILHISKSRIRQDIGRVLAQIRVCLL